MFVYYIYAFIFTAQQVQSTLNSTSSTATTTIPEGSIILQQMVWITRISNNLHIRTFLFILSVWHLDIRIELNVSGIGVLVQVRSGKNGSNEGPILLQTLKRLEKSQQKVSYARQILFGCRNLTNDLLIISSTQTSTSHLLRYCFFGMLRQQSVPQPARWQQPRRTPSKQHRLPPPPHRLPYLTLRKTTIDQKSSRKDDRIHLIFHWALVSNTSYTLI